MPVPSPQSDPRSEAELLLAVAGQDGEALEVLYHRLGGRLVAYVRAMAGASANAEEVVQDVFVALWEKAGLFRPGIGSAEAWIFTLARHRVVDIWRARSRVGEVGEEPLMTMADPVEDAFGLDRMALQQVLARLAPDQRRPLELAYFGDLTYEETARQLSLPVGTVKSRIRASLAQLRRWMEARP